MRIKGFWLGAWLGLCLAMPAPAGWVNDWVAQKTVSGPNFARIDGENMLTLGGANVRWRRGAGPTALLAFERPRFNVGCGGIDAKFGGAWFAGIDALVQKIQSIIQNAAAIMFKMALDTISNSLSSASGWVEDVIRKVNEFSADECQAAQKLAATLDKNGISLKPAAMALTQKLGLSEVATNTGAAADPAQAADKAGNTNSPPVPESTVRASCPTEIQKLLPAGAGRISILLRATQSTGVARWTDVLRGMVGDVVIGLNTNKRGDTYASSNIAPCYDNDKISFDDLLEGTLKRRPANGGACVRDDVRSRGIRWFVENDMKRIAAFWANNPGAPLPPAIQAAYTPLPSYARQWLRMGVMNQVGNDAAREIADLVAAHYAYRSLDDLYRTVISTLEQYDELVQRHPAKLAECKIAVVQKLPTLLHDWSKTLYKHTVAARDYYFQQVTRYQQNLELSRAILQMAKAQDQKSQKRLPQQDNKQGN